MSSNLEFTKSCAFCGSSFIAKKLTTKYCTHKCASRAYKQRKRDEKIQVSIGSDDDFKRELQQEFSNESKPIQNNSTNLYTDIMNIDDVAILMKVNRMTIYRYCVQGKLKCIKMNRKIFIRRQDIDTLFDSAPPYQVTPRKKTQEQSKVEPKVPVCKQTIAPEISETKEAKSSNQRQQKLLIVDFYTASQLSELCGCSNSAIHKLAASRQIPKAVKNGVYLYSKSHCDEAFSDRYIDTTITEWYSVEEIMEKYSMKRSTVHSFTSEKRINKRNLDGRTIYAKAEIDEQLAYRLGDPSITEWYSIEEIKDSSYLSL